ncbi:YsnF/AvaK domain-containing protein [Dyadobacter luticola]|uniref:DUF2382 domain-containing protein n=1 Tax=Dyadobacter luticola TaxID=1979387 RepID=A0A5R9KYX4_9BACT|nr:YsnF/AvaK domain-containing protein [Dyadobacter luticola]TLV01512.1 DUF2382 domain-containing protein [Dyadobacter luticola]
MANTVVGIFERESDAQEAQNFLLANGFADGDVDIKTATYKSDSEVVEEEHDLGDRIGNFFSNLFDGDEDDTKRYSEAGKRNTIVTVHAVDREEAHTAARILDQFGALDVDADKTNSYSDADTSYSGTNISGTNTSYTDPETPYATAGIGYAATDNDAAINQYSDTDDITETDRTVATGYTAVDPSYSTEINPSYSTGVNPSYPTEVDSYSPAEQGYTTPSNPITDEVYVSEDEKASLPVIEEELSVSKREIETGGVRLRSRIIERPVQESIRLRQETVTINRTPVDRIATGSEFDTFQEGTIEMKEYAEIPVVSKEARVIQEVSLSKTVDEREEIINETLRSTEVDVEDLTDEERLRRQGLDL